MSKIYFLWVLLVLDFTYLSPSSRYFICMSLLQAYNAYTIHFLLMLQQSELVKLKEETTRINSKIKSTTKELNKRKEEKKRHLVEIAKLENDLKDVTRQLEDLREKSQDAGGKLQLVDSELETYHQM